jgi:hypothetical protein
MTKLISIARDFARSPSGRYRTDGPNSGERFREDFLYPELQKGPVVVDLDGVLTLGSSFLDEAFGGLVREKGMTPAQLRSVLSIRSRLETYANRIWSYIEDPRNRKR